MWHRNLHEYVKVKSDAFVFILKWQVCKESCFGSWCPFMIAMRTAFYTSSVRASSECIDERTELWYEMPELLEMELAFWYFHHVFNLITFHTCRFLRLCIVWLVSMVHERFRNPDTITDVKLRLQNTSENAVTRWRLMNHESLGSLVWKAPLVPAIPPSFLNFLSFHFCCIDNVIAHRVRPRTRTSIFQAYRS